MEKMEMDLNSTYVYHHVIDGVIFYVGMGSGDRAFNNDRRSNKWWRVVNGCNKKYKVKIVRRFESKVDARDFELSEIIRIRPVANTEGIPIDCNPTLPRTRKESPKQKKYRNSLIIAEHAKGLGARRIAKMFNITPQRVSAIIKRYGSSGSTPTKNGRKNS